MRKTMRGKWPNKDCESIVSADLWAAYKAEYKKFRTDSKEGQKRKDDLSIESLVMCYLYPRLDANVSTSINHLLKSPFCVHPKTGKCFTIALISFCLSLGKICVPIDPKDPDSFKLNDVPTLT